MTDKPKLPEKIDTNLIRGHWMSWDGRSGGDDTIKSIEIVAEKVNQLISYLEEKDK